MIALLSIKELRKRAGKEGVPQAVLEKDYVLSVALNAIAGAELCKHVVFKGGTALRKVYFKEARFSEDLDFNALDLSKNEVLNNLSEALGSKTLEGIRFEVVEEEETRAGLKASVKYFGPLEYAQRIKFDFSFRENMVDAPVKKPLIDEYNLGVHEVLVLGLEEIFAEKVHALGSRSAPRDLYDTWFLASKGVVVNRKTIDKKFAYYGEAFDKQKTNAFIEKMKINWEKDLRRLVKILPKFEEIASEVKT